MRDDSPWDKEGFRLKNIRIRRTVYRKIACPHFTLFLSSVGLLPVVVELVVGQVIRCGEGIGEIGRAVGGEINK